MHLGDWLVLAVLVLLVGLIRAGRMKEKRARRTSMPSKHKARTGVATHDEAKRLIHSAKGHDSY